MKVNMINKLLFVFIMFGHAHMAYAKDVASFKVISTTGSNQTDIPVTLGHVFAPGDVPGDHALFATLADGVTSVPLQIDAKATHRDGSLRHAVVTARIPSLSGGASESVILTASNGAYSNTNPVLISDVLAASGFDAVVSLGVGGTVYSSSVIDLFGTGTIEQWLKGELVSEWLVSGPLKDGNGNEHKHLTAYYHIRAYGKPVSGIRINVVVENNWSYQSGPSTFNYTATIKVAGSTDTKTVDHYHHARWNEIYWWGKKSLADVKHGRDYLLDSGAVANYDRSLNVATKLLDSMLTTWAPMERGSVNNYMPGTGAHVGIGPLPQWTAAYVISQDLGAKRSTLLNGRASGSYPLHFRDKATGKPVSIDTHPKAGYNQGDFSSLVGGMSSVDPSYSDPTKTLNVDTAHHPDLAYVPYLVTGDYFYLEELQFWANYCMLRESPGTRGDGGSKGLVINAQPRGQGWCMRALGEAAYITPDAHIMKDYFIKKLTNNIAHYDTIYTYGKGTSDYWNVFGALRPTNVAKMDNTRPWMDDFFTWAIGHLVEMGFTEAVPLRAWKAQYPVGRMTKMCYIEGINYGNKLGTNNPPIFYKSWDEFYEVNYGSLTNGTGTFRDKACASQAMADWKNANGDKGANGGTWTPGMMSGRAHSYDSYYANVQPAMAIAKDSGIANADVAWALFTGKNTDPAYPFPGTPFTPNDFSAYAASPQFAVVPRAVPIKVIGPEISLTATAYVVNEGDTPSIEWTAATANSCQASGDWSGNRPTSGSEVVGPIKADSLFILKCSDNTDTSTSSLTISIAPTNMGGGTGSGGTDSGTGSGTGDGPNTGGSDTSNGSVGTDDISTANSTGGGGALHLLELLIYLLLMPVIYLQQDKTRKS